MALVKNPAPRAQGVKVKKCLQMFFLVIAFTCNIFSFDISGDLIFFLLFQHFISKVNKL